MIKADGENPENTPVRKTRNGNKLFNGAEDGVPFVKGVPKTEEQKQAMRDGWARKKAKEEFIDRIYGRVNELSKKTNLTNREIIDLAKIAIEISGDKKETQALTGGVEVQKVYIDEKTKETYKKHIYDFINGSNK